MKKTSHFLLGIIAMGAGSASAFTLSTFRSAPEISIPLPALPDSLEKENPFDAATLLDGRSWIPADADSKDWDILEADTAGVVTLGNAEDMPRLNSFYTRLRAARFTKGKFRFSSTSKGAVRVNGNKLITRSSADSTLTESESAFTLEPERTYDITVDMLPAPGDKSAPAFRLEFIPDEKYADIALKASPDASRRVTPHTIIGGERTYSSSLSADGRYLLTVTRESVSATVTTWRAKVIETASGRVMAEDMDPTAQWMPEGAALYYSKQNGDVYDFYTLEFPTMKKSLLAAGLPDKNCSPMPGGEYMLYFKNVEAEKGSGPMHRIASPDDRIPGNRDRAYLMRYDLRNHLSTPLTYGGNSTGLLACSDDGSKILYSSTRQTPEKYPFYYVSLIEMDMKTLRTDTLVRDEEGYVSSAVYSPDTSRIFIVSGPDAFGKIGANYGDHEIGNGFDGQGFILDRASGKISAMTRDFDPAVTGSPVWNRNGRIYFLGEKEFFQSIYTLDPASGKIEEIKTSAPYVRSFSIGENESEWLAFVGGSFTTDGQTGIINLRNGRERIVTDPLAPSLEGTEFGEMHRWTFISDGTEIDGYYCLPPGFDATEKYPLIVYYYGGTSPSDASFRHLYSPQVFASRDYVVYVVNPSGTTGYGQEFSARHVNAWGRQTADDIIRGVKKFCADHPFVDDKKIGCLGASYGGFMTMYLQTLTDIFTAAVSHAGISNVTSYWGEGYWGYSYNSVAAARSYPWNNPDLFTRQGALFNADKIHTPLLLLHGEEDTNVPIGESIQLFNALKILGRDVEFITVEKENHVISGFDRKPAWQNTIMAWFAKWLQDDPRWWNELYGE